MMGNKVHFTSLGCARNLVDTEVMLGILLKSGYEATPDPYQADWLVINTCGFLEAARKEAYDVLEELITNGKKGSKVIVAGCMVRDHKEALKEKFPQIHYFLGSGDIEKILEAISSSESGEHVSSAKSYLQMGEVPRHISTPKHYAYLKIAEGCKKRCSYCIIPDIKGKLQSKPEKQVLKEFHALLKSGVKEVILIAQDLGDYGKDFGEKEALTSLLQKMLETPGDYWIRLLYLYPDEITEGMIDLIASDKRLCPYLDMPIQHINDLILKRMHRKTTGQEIKNTITLLREKIPQIVIRTSLIVGFPGETEEDFLELSEFVKWAKLDNVGIFPYSKEEGSYSAKLDGHLEESIKQDRFKRLAELQKEVVATRNEKYIGQKLRVLVEGYHPESNALLVGRYYGQCPEIDGTVILNDFRKVDRLGEFYEVEITDSLEYDLLGRVVRKDSKKQKQTLALVS